MLPEASEVGISVYDLTAKKSLYTYRDTKLSRPASTMKLLTAITALSRPDADNPFRTEVWHDGVIEHDTLQGNLYVVGGFDPEFDSLMMDSLIEEVITFPFSVINGQVYGDVSMKDSLYWGHGWAWDDTPEAYQPYMSPLMFCPVRQGIIRRHRLTGNACRISLQRAGNHRHLHSTLTKHQRRHIRLISLRSMAMFR